MQGHKSLVLIGFLQLLSYSYTSPIGECTSGVEFLTDDSDCSVFYQCSDGTPAQLRCYNGLYFDINTHTCEWPHSVTCEVSSAGSNESEENEVEGSGEVEVENPWIGECPAENGATVVFLQHASDCTKYYACDHGTAILMSCLDGLHFNVDLGVCDWPDDAGCEVDLYFF